MRFKGHLTLGPTEVLPFSINGPWARGAQRWVRSDACPPASKAPSRTFSSQELMTTRTTVCPAPSMCKALSAALR